MTRLARRAPRARTFFAPFGWRRALRDTVVGLHRLTFGEGLFLGLVEGAVLTAALFALPA